MYHNGNDIPTSSLKESAKSYWARLKGFKSLDISASTCRLIKLRMNEYSELLCE